MIEVKNVATNLVDVYLGSRAAIDEESGLTSTVTSETITLKMSDSASVAFHKAAAAVSTWAASITVLGTPHFVALMKHKKDKKAKAKTEKEKETAALLATFQSEGEIEEKEGAAWLEVDDEYDTKLKAPDAEKAAAVGMLAKKKASQNYEAVRLEKQSKLDEIGVRFTSIKRQFKAAQDAADSTETKRKRAAPSGNWNAFQQECASMGITSQHKVKELWDQQKAKAARLADEAARDNANADADDADAGDTADDAPPPPTIVPGVEDGAAAAAAAAPSAASAAGAATAARPTMIGTWRAALRE